MLENVESVKRNIYTDLRDQKHMETIIQRHQIT